MVPHFPEKLHLFSARIPDTHTSWLHMKEQEYTEDDAREGLRQRFFYHVVINSSLFLAGVLTSCLADEISLTRQSFSKKFVGGLDISAHINAQTTVSAHEMSMHTGEEVLPWQTQDGEDRLSQRRGMCSNVHSYVVT